MAPAHSRRFGDCRWETYRLYGRMVTVDCWGADPRPGLGPILEVVAMRTTTPEPAFGLLVQLEGSDAGFEGCQVFVLHAI